MGPVNYKGQVPAVAAKITIYLFNHSRRGRDSEDDKVKEETHRLGRGGHSRRVSVHAQQ